MDTTRRRYVDEGDFTLTGEHCWIMAGNISVKIQTTDEGVVVDLYRLGNEMDDSIGSTWALFAEGGTTFPHDPEKCGCTYQGMGMWSCGHIDNMGRSKK